jgi:hypothetical protein
MTEFLSKELKFYIKLLGFQPFLIRKEVTEHIPHQKEQLSAFDVIHISVLVLGTVNCQYSNETGIQSYVLVPRPSERQDMMQPSSAVWCEVKLILTR